MTWNKENYQKKIKSLTMNTKKVKEEKYKKYVNHRIKMGARLNAIEGGLSRIKRDYAKPGFKDIYMLKNLNADQLISFYGDMKQFQSWLEDIKHDTIQAIAVSELVEELLKEENKKN